MEAKLKTLGSVSVISLIGSLDIEETQILHRACTRNFLSQKLILDMSEAVFVGSTGIQAFLETVRMLSATCPFPVQMVGAKSEFRRIFANLELANLHFCETQKEAVQKLTVAPGLSLVTGNPVTKGPATSDPVPSDPVVLGDLKPAADSDQH